MGSDSFSVTDNNITMIFEDYISKEAIGTASWKGPLSTKHNKAILCTFVTALVLSLATKTDFYSSEDEFVAQRTASAAKDFEIPTIDETAPLVQTYVAEDKKKALENYDDVLSDVDLADSDAQIDKEVTTLAQRVDKDKEATSVGAKWISETVQSGDNISSLFSDLNIPATTLANMLEDNKNFKSKVNSLKIGDNLSFLVSNEGELLVFIKPISDKEQIRFYKSDKNGHYTAVREKLNSYVKDDDATSTALAMAQTSTGNKAANTEPEKAVATVEAEKVKEVTASNRGRLVLVTINQGESFSKAANRSGITYSEINRILQMFRGKIQFSRHIREGDTMRVLFSDSHGKGKICAVEFQLAHGGKIATYLNSSDGKYYDENGLVNSHSSFNRFPFHARVRVTSQFNPSRRHPVTGVVRPHNGVDFGLPVGTIISAPADGIVDKAAFSRSAGYYVVIRHSGGLSTVYMHLSKLHVHPGQRVKQGVVIARSGNTGISTGPHLHYEVRVNGRAVNPLRVKLEGHGGSNINSKERKAFAASVQRYKKELHQSNLIAALH